MSGYGTPILSADGSRAVISTSAYDSATGTDVTLVTVIDTATGTQSGIASTLPGSSPDQVQLNANGSRVLIAAVGGDWSTGFTTRIEVFDTTTGTQTGATVDLDGAATSTQLSADGTRVLITTSAYDSTVGFTARVAVINAATGTQVGSRSCWQETRSNTGQRRR